MKPTTHINEHSISELLSEYYSGNISAEKSSALEKLAETDNFLKEAMEGYSEMPEAIHSIPSFDASSSSFINPLTVTLSVIFIAIAGIMFFGLLNPIEKKEALVVSGFKEKSELPEVQEKSIVMDNKVEEKSIPKEIQKQVKEQKHKTLPKPSEKEPSIEQIDLPKISLDPVQFQKKIDYTVKKAKTKAIGYFGFLAVDYSLIYSNTIETEPHFSGTDASKANLKSKSTILDNGLTRNIYTYKEFLKQTCYFMKERNFYLAIKNLKTILKEFPRDVNAEFYLGYCYYEMGKYEKAISYFELASTNGFGFFEEDAEWFKANSLENLGKQSEANKIYKSIKEKGGYYSHRIR